MTEQLFEAGAPHSAIARRMDALVRDMDSRVQELTGQAEVHRKLREWAHEESTRARANEAWKWLTRLKSDLDAALRACASEQSATRRWTDVLCTKCGGNGVIRIPGGVSQCPRCDGRCYEPDVVETL